jgi:hypothetical protein
MGFRVASEMGTSLQFKLGFAIFCLFLLLVLLMLVQFTCKHSVLHVGAFGMSPVKNYPSENGEEEVNYPMLDWSPIFPFQCIPIWNRYWDLLGSVVEGREIVMHPETGQSLVSLHSRVMWNPKFGTAKF